MSDQSGPRPQRAAVENTVPPPSGEGPKRKFVAIEDKRSNEGNERVRRAQELETAREEKLALAKQLAKVRKQLAWERDARKGAERQRMNALDLCQIAQEETDCLKRSRNSLRGALTRAKRAEAAEVGRLRRYIRTAQDDIAAKSERAETLKVALDAAESEIVELKRRTEELQEGGKCAVCWDVEANTAVKECGHLAMCARVSSL